MAITTIDGALAGMRPMMMFSKVSTGTVVVGRPHSLWKLAGNPGIGGFDTTLNGVTLSSSSALVDGQIPHYDPASGNSYLARLSATPSQPGGLWLMDRLWHNGGIAITSTGAQSITSPTWPSRCPTSGTNDIPATAGHGVLLAVEVSATTGVGTPTITISYTNSAGDPGRTATNILATTASSVAGATYFIGLQAGDVGVQSVESITLSATWTSGTINIVAYRPLVFLELPLANTSYAIDGITGGFPRMYNGTVPWMIFQPVGTTSTSISGTYTETQG